MRPRDPPSPPPTEVHGTILGSIDGVYHITCSEIEYQWPDQIPEKGMTMRLVQKDDAVWGSYDLGVWEGVFHMQQGPTQPSLDKLQFFWRGHSVEEGEVDFGPNCEGTIQFLGGGELRGTICGLHADMDFRGRWIKENDTTAPRTLAQIQKEWHMYKLNSEDYDDGFDDEDDEY